MTSQYIMDIVHLDNILGSCRPMAHHAQQNYEVDFNLPSCYIATLSLLRHQKTLTQTENKTKK